jgi:hypothetical protein
VFSLYQRCSKIWLMTLRLLECPRCGTAFYLRMRSLWRLLPGSQSCSGQGCGWETTAEAWHASRKHRDLLGTAAQPSMETYLDDYLHAHTTAEKVLYIDQLVHSFHISLRTGKVGRSFANNLYETTCAL